MSASTADRTLMPWWKEPTKDQWLAWVAAWLGWTLDAFDFTIFLLLMVPISKDFGVPLTQVAIVFTLTLWMRLIGATASGWLSDRYGRKKPLMISIAWFSVCNLLAGLSPSFWLLLVFRTLLGIGMGAEWPAGAALAMETWPQRSRGFMGSVLQGSWGLGALLSSGAYFLFFDSIGWRGLLLIGVLPAVVIVYIRKYVKEPQIWIENRRKQVAENKQFRTPLWSIFRRNVLGNTLTACWLMASAFVVGYSVGGMFASYLQKDLGLPTTYVALPIMLQSLMFFLSAILWGVVSDRFGRKKTLLITALVTIPITPLYLITTDYTMIVVFFALQGWFGGGGMHTQWPHYLSERFPTEVRATATGFCYHQGAIFGGLVGPILTYFATDLHMGFAIPMMIATIVGACSVALSMVFSPETKGTELTADIMLAA
jgi:SHS family lactate transporter-like MFS transporter